MVKLIQSEIKNKIEKYLTSFTLERNLESFFSPADQPQTIIEPFEINGIKTKRYVNEFWTARQRQSSSIHEISYRACFKAQLPRFCIKLLTKSNDTVYDPFSGRGTTVIEAAMLNREVISNDVNPLSEILSYPRFFIPEIKEVENRLNEIETDSSLESDLELSMFYHEKTLQEILSLRDYLERRSEENVEDSIDKWIRMIATNRLTGHSKGFFSVYTLPPNQAVSQESQIKINQKRNQVPDYRDIRKLIVRKTKSLIRTVTPSEKRSLAEIGKSATFLTSDVGETKSIKDDSVELIVTSPPFLDIVQYSKDNWLRCWFNNINVDTIEKKITTLKKVEDWSEFIGEAFKEFYRIIKPGGSVAFEVGEVRKGKIKLDEYVLPLGVKAGFEALGIIINLQEFTKTSNIWGVGNNSFGTNTNRIVLFGK